MRRSIMTQSLIPEMNARVAVNSEMHFKMAQPLESFWRQHG